jgi:hypothetical protein
MDQCKTWAYSNYGWKYVYEDEFFLKKPWKFEKN